MDVNSPFPVSYNTLINYKSEQNVIPTAMGIIQTKEATSKRQAMKTPKRQKNKNLKIQNKKPSTEILNETLFHTVVKKLLSIIINLEILKFIWIISSLELLSIFGNKTFITTGSDKDHRISNWPIKRRGICNVSL